MIKRVLEPSLLQELLNTKEEYERAYKLVEILFKDKRDKEGSPYLSHLVRVSNSLKEDSTKIAGLLHDVVEDIEGFTFDDLTYLGFNRNVIELVMLVTKDYESKGMTPEEKKEAYHQKITNIIESNNVEAVKLKYADMSDNLMESRLAHLDEKTRIHLFNKYKEEIGRLKSYLVERNCLYE